MRLPYLIILALSISTPLRGSFISFNVAGSDFMPGGYWQAATAIASLQGMHFRIEARGSSLAMRSLEKNSADLAVVANPLEQQPVDSKWAQTALASRVLTVIVHKDNPIREISVKQLAGIYGAVGEHGPRSHWSSLGLLAPWDTPTIKAYLPKESGEPLTVDLFQAIVIPHIDLHAGIHRMNSSDQVINAVISDPHSIGVIEGVCTRAGVKTLAIAAYSYSSSNSPAIAFLPTPEAVYDGDYPLRLPFIIICARSRVNALQPAIDALKSEKCKEALKESGFVVQ